MSSGSSKTAAKTFTACGYWKVYTDPTAAQAEFDRYKKCERIYARCYYNGTRLVVEPVMANGSPDGDAETACAAGETVTIRRISGKDEVRLHLAELGFVVGSEVTVVNEIAGNLIVQVKQSRLALDKTMASRIMVD